MDGWDDGASTAQALAAFGLQADLPAPKPLDIWPENWMALNVFYAMRRQWHVGMAGPVGLRYEAFGPVREALGVQPQDWPEVLEGVQEIEGETLRLWAEKRG